MGKKKKRRLTKEEVAEVEEWMDSAPRHAKPSIRQIAKRYGVNRSSVLKSLGGWEGLQRGRPDPKPGPLFGTRITKDKQSPISIQPYEVKIPEIKRNA